jgi:APA family basic amino acid/polyamine antiporter
MQPTDTRQLGFWMTWALVVGTMIGSGIFLLPVSLAPFGANAVVGWVVSGLGAVALAYALGRLARDGGHGIQAAIEHAFGPFIAFVATFALWISSWTSMAAVAISGGAAIARLVPAVSDDRSIAMVAIGLLALFQITNALGVKSAGRMAVVTTLIKILPLVAVLLVLGQVTGAGQPVAPLGPMPLALDNIAAASAITLFAMLGFETAMTPVDKIRNPERTIPLALISGTAMVALLYLASSTAITWLLSPAGTAASNSPFADAIARGWGEAGATFAAVGIAVAAAGYINCTILGTGELGYSMALRREMPAAFRHTRRGNLPLNAQLMGSGLAAALIVANMAKSTADLFTFMALLTTSATLWLYLAAALAAWKQRPHPIAAAVIVAALAFTAFAFYGSGLEANAWSLVLLAAGVAVYWIMRWRRGSSPAEAETAA